MRAMHKSTSGDVIETDEGVVRRHQQLASLLMMPCNSPVFAPKAGPELVPNTEGPEFAAAEAPPKEKLLEPAEAILHADEICVYSPQ